MLRIGSRTRLFGQVNAAIVYPGSRISGGRTRRSVVGAITLLVLGLLCMTPLAQGTESGQKSFSAWEPLLWGGSISSPDAVPAKAGTTSTEENDRIAQDRAIVETIVKSALQDILFSPAETAVSENGEIALDQPVKPGFASRPRAAVPAMSFKFPQIPCRDPFRGLSLKSIPPLYVSPKLPGEGVWSSKDMPKGENGWPTIYHTIYRPSHKYPNAIVHMLLFDMKQVSTRLYVGSGEPGAEMAASKIEGEDQTRLLAITNGLWRRRHSRGAGAMFGGQVLERLRPGMATIVIYKDGSADILEWNDSIPESTILDARQLRHLIVKDGKVVETVMEEGRMVDSEIGLGYLLVEEMPILGRWGPSGPPVLNPTTGEEWFIATRSAFGVRPDGNLVFAAGHHISTKDLAKALVLAGCVRAIHGDANPHNVVGNLYYKDGSGKIADMAKLSPNQQDTGLRRYISTDYSSDFFAFFQRSRSRNTSAVADPKSRL